VAAPKERYSAMARGIHRHMAISESAAMSGGEASVARRPPAEADNQ
jgi:hypothetical protein